MKVLGLFFYYIIQWTWGLIQNLLGLCLYIKLKKCRHQWYHGAKLTYHEGDWGGVSLGMFIFVNGKKDAEWIKTTNVHEYGHTLQSLLLGPFYLFVIGIPSSIWCNNKKYITLRKEKGISYFDFYPEKWANRWGELVTKELAPNR